MMATGPSVGALLRKQIPMPAGSEGSDSESDAADSDEEAPALGDKRPASTAASERVVRSK